MQSSVSQREKRTTYCHRLQSPFSLDPSHRRETTPSTCCIPSPSCYRHRSVAPHILLGCTSTLRLLPWHTRHPLPLVRCPQVQPSPRVIQHSNCGNTPRNREIRQQIGRHGVPGDRKSVG